MKLLSVVLLLLPLSLCLAEVVDDFTESCPQFFANPYHVVSPPTGFTGDRFRKICQTLNNKAEFATLYDTENRIPVYSAYRFTGLMKCKRRMGNWYIEPQLESGTLGPNMATESAVRKQGVNIVNQAVNGDYKYSGYDKGHLAPVFHATSQNCADATFTLTNAAPQAAMFNRNTWMRTEKSMNDTLTKSCLNVGLRAFVVTGVVPGPDTLKNEGRVRIPSHFWMAFCCLDSNNIPRRSGAFYGKKDDSVKEKDESEKEKDESVKEKDESVKEKDESVKEKDESVKEKDESEKEKDDSVKEKDEFVVYPRSVKNMETELTQLYKIHVNNIPDFRFTLFAGECYTETEPMEKQLVVKASKRKKGTKDCKPNKCRKL
ncbi:uncharacterized protein LOC128629234 [Ictalurus punctatus]|uniref:Uncharacterized protein LOC128629234 n=1 Tax=Ictalurus punctatus TaxID=7998 RepID=A0A9F7R251_ICTPU|nr:uncharacterized protein LOC128629234 [Ictalurus punctatus]